MTSNPLFSASTDVESVGGSSTAILQANANFLEETSYVNISNPLVTDLAHRLTGHLKSEREKACAIFGYVRDEVKFGWTYQFSSMKASDVIITGCGYSLTKATLFVALLRRVGIPSKQIFVDISCEILHGLGFPSDLYLDHCYVELFLEGSWVKTDSYILDRELFVSSRERLLSENLKIGYGVHANGTMEWDGIGDAFCQLVDDGLFPSLSLINYGHKKDVAEFYQTVSDCHNNFDIFFPLTAVFFLSFYIPNSRVSQLRKDKDCDFSIIPW
jgi:hypothetical protein